MNQRFELVGVALISTLLLCPVPAMAQAIESPDMGDDRLDATGVGIAGGTIVGGELVVVVEALIGVDKLWAYLTFPFVGAAGGGVGGYYLEQASPEGAVALLVGGLALLVPTAILASKAMAYHPEEEGALDSDAHGVEIFSFEATPTGEPRDEATTTEVESRPEDVPEGTATPPEGEQPPEEAVPPSEEVPPENDVEGEAPEGEDRSSSRLSEKRRLAKRARLKRATAGSLLYVNSEGSTGFTVPFVDVRPARYSYNMPGVKAGVEVYLPLLRIDLP